MSEPEIVGVLTGIRDRLAAVRVGNGYHTDVGLVLHSGWPRYLLAQQQLGLPVAAIYPANDAPESRQRNRIKAARTIQIELLADQHETPPEWFDYALHDIRRALQGLETQFHGVITGETGAASWEDLDNPAIVRLVIPVTISYTDRYGDLS